MVMRFLFAAAALVSCMLALPAGAETRGLTPVPEPIAAPALGVADLAGRVHAMEGYRGRRVLVSFWASWCAPCRVEMPSLARLDAATDDDELAVLAVNLGDTPEKIDRFLSMVDTGSLTILSDPDNALAEPWHIVGLPVTYVVAPDGTLSQVALGPREWDDPAIVASIMSAGD